MLQIAVCEDEQTDRDNLIGILKPLLDKYTEEYRITDFTSGGELLYYSSDSKAEGLGISQLGVVDLEKGTFIAFDREGYGNLYEEGIG